MDIGVAEDGGSIAAEARLVRPGAAKGAAVRRGWRRSSSGPLRSTSGRWANTAPGGRAGCRRARSVGLVGMGGRRSTGDPDPDALADADPDTALRRSEPGEPPSLVEAMVRKSTGAASISLVPRLCRETEGRSLAGGCSAEEPQLNDHSALPSGGVSSSSCFGASGPVAAQSAASSRASLALSSHPPSPWAPNIQTCGVLRGFLPTQPAQVNKLRMGVG